MEPTSKHKFDDEQPTPPPYDFDRFTLELTEDCWNSLVAWQKEMIERTEHWRASTQELYRQRLEAEREKAEQHNAGVPARVAAAVEEAYQKRLSSKLPSVRERAKNDAFNNGMGCCLGTLVVSVIVIALSSVATFLIIQRFTTP